MPRLKKAWHLVRRRLGAGKQLPMRLVVQKDEWPDGALSPVMLMVDDLTNAWHSSSSGGTWDQGGDWGGGLRKPGSILRVLEDGLFREFGNVKATFFTVAGPISPYTHHQPFSFAEPLDFDVESREFFGSLVENPRYELAYHGFNHGIPGQTSAQFTQEWRGFPSVAAAVEQTKRGLEIFRRATGVIPAGGKYGGWAYNEFAEDALNECGFSWWCRDWTPRAIDGSVPDSYYEPQLFGKNLVVALPSTVHGFYWDRKQIDILLNRRQVIAIAEHIAAVRPDGLVQTPNLVDDMDELRRLFVYLADKHVWYANGSEIADYVVTRDNTLIYDVSRDGFSIRYLDGRARAKLTLTVDCSAVCSPSENRIDVILPDGSAVPPADVRFDHSGYRHSVSVPIADGRYLIRPRAA